MGAEEFRKAPMMHHKLTTLASGEICSAKYFTLGWSSVGVPESNSGISFLKFSVSRHLLKLFYDELRSFSSFFALNFDKKLAVE
jgi:hypothetical protein